MRCRRIFDLLEYNVERYHQRVALASKKGGKWITYSSEEYAHYADWLSYAMLAKGLSKGDKVSTISINRPEWNFVDMGILQIGGIHVPLYPTINDDDLIYILKEADVKLIFVGNKYLYNKIKNLSGQLPTLLAVYSFDEVEGCISFSEFVQFGKSNIQKDLLERLKASVSPYDLASIIYTSGTTGLPKGVMLTHENHLSNSLVAAYTINLKSTYTELSFLPLSHSYERMVNYVMLYLGMSVYYADVTSNILLNFQEIRPQLMITVPLLLEKVYQGILKKRLELGNIQRFVFDWALKLAKRFEIGKDMGGWYRWKLSIADRLVFVKWREALGNSLVKIVTGGASVRPELVNIFWAAGIKVYEGYGLTEASPLIAFNTETDIKVGTIGKAIPDILVKVSDEGELLVNGPNVMKGYYKHPELTSKVIEPDGWLHTGDLATIDEEGFITITGRKNEIFKMASGVYVNPEKLENKLQQSFFISQAFVVGQNQSFLSALILPDFDYIKEYFAHQGVHFNSNLEIIQNQKVISLIDQEINMLNGYGIKENENIQRFALVADDWTIESGELSPSLKLKRRVILEKYKDVIRNFYQKVDDL
ncbi:MAG: AMP-dependent synthetase and ligase [Bacteroidetes bacterium 38_7]|nr:MAG: AMP-dependent synthetase and ligase [Bacteroidetes bacterium 38_7]HAL65556.1 long-chain fatty acid--CoA ligase [Bacteroidales bacterium]